MVKKSENEATESASQLSDKIKGSARQIWLAGLGAYNKAEEDAGKIFDKLVKEGEELEHMTRDTVGKSFKAVEDRVEEVKDRVGGVKEKANDTFGKLESIFDQRVSAALVRLGIPTKRRITELEKRIEELEAELKRLRSG